MSLVQASPLGSAGRSDGPNCPQDDRDLSSCMPVRSCLTMDTGPTTVVLTALDLEYDAVRSHLTDLRTRVHPAGTHFEVGIVRGSTVRVGLAAVGAGNRAAAVLVERSMAMFHPGTILFTGVAGALHTDIQVGDVVVATRVYGYQSGAEEQGEFLARPRVWNAPHHLLQQARHVVRTDWWRRIPSAATDAQPFAIFFRPVAAGEVVLDSPTGPSVDLIRRHYNDVAAIEMESAGAAEAAHLNQAVPLLTIRGISDHADGRKIETDMTGGQSVAAAHAAAFTAALLLTLGTTIKESPEHNEAGRPVATGDRITIRVGGNVSGQITTGDGNTVSQIRERQRPPDAKSEQADLLVRFADLRTRLAADGTRTNGAQAKLAELQEAILADVPDLPTMEYALHWFRRKLPRFADAVSALILHPDTNRRIADRGAELVQEYTRRFS